MAVASSLRIVERRAEEYLWLDSVPALEELRKFIELHILPFKKVGILGGLIRELARKGKVGFYSDADFVIDAPARDVKKLAKQLGATANRFGGYGYRHPLWKIDFWALETTWAIKQGYVAVKTLSDVTACTFFDCDAIFYDLISHKVFADDDYLKRLKSKTIEINLYENPAAEGNLVRAIRRILYWNFFPGPKLTQFISENLDSDAMRRVVETEKRLYVHSAAEHFTRVEDLKAALFSSRHRLWLKTSLVE